MDKKCYILKDGWYFRPDARGYTDKREDAGVFELDYGLDYNKGCHNTLVIKETTIDEHNEFIHLLIIELQKKLIGWGT